MDELVKAIAEAIHDGPLMADDHEYGSKPEVQTWCEDIAKAALRAIDAAGWQCVPKEPTDEMKAQVEPTLDDVYNGNKGEPGYEYTGGKIYEAMLAAAPKLEKSND